MAATRDTPFLDEPAPPLASETQAKARAPAPQEELFEDPFDDREKGELRVEAEREVAGEDVERLREEDAAEEDVDERREEEAGLLLQPPPTNPSYEVLAAAFEAAERAGEAGGWEAEIDEEAESGDVELGEAQAFLETLYGREPAFDEETPATVTFPSGASLRIVSGATGPGEEHYDPNRAANPLLDTSERVRTTRLSANFTVGELARSGGRQFDKARIDPKLVRCLQRLHDNVGRAVHVSSGYRPYLYNVDVYKRRHKKPTMSRHSSGQAADVRIAGMTGMQIAQAAIDACGTDIGVGIADDNAHVDVRGRWARWTYFSDKARSARGIAEIEEYRRSRRGGAPVLAHGVDSAPPGGVAARMLEALGRGLWTTAVRIAIDSGITDVNRLTNMLFYLRHPEMRGKRIEPHQRDLARGWLDIRERYVRPAIESSERTPRPRSQ